jgi:hypothetical protein
MVSQGGIGLNAAYMLYISTFRCPATCNRGFLAVAQRSLDWLLGYIAYGGVSAGNSYQSPDKQKPAVMPGLIHK